MMRLCGATAELSCMHPRATFAPTRSVSPISGMVVDAFHVKAVRPSRARFVGRGAKLVKNSMNAIALQRLEAAVKSRAAAACAAPKSRLRFSLDIK